MRITEVQVSNYRCFEEGSLELEPGVTVIHGPNGAGKTTLLEAILFGLYGSKALEDATLEDIMTTGTDETTVDLRFVHESGAYHIARELAITGDRPSTRRCVLETPDDEVIEGARPVREYVTELLRMDADAFVNSAYVKQGEINKLLHATPAERQSMIDELLQLGKLEIYRDRADSARLAVRSLQSELQELIDEVTTQLEPLTTPDPYERLNELETKRASLVERIEKTSTRRDELLSKQREIEDAIERVDEKREEIERLNERRSDLRSTIDETDQAQTSIRNELTTEREALDSLRASRDEAMDALDIDDTDALKELGEAIEEEQRTVEDQIESLRESIHTSRAQRAEASERLETVSEQLESIEEERASLIESIEADKEIIEQRTAELHELDEEIEHRGSSLDDWPLQHDERERALKEQHSALEEHRQRLQSARERMAALREHIEQAESLMAEEKCPTCGQPVAEAPHVERLEEDKEALAQASGQAARIRERIDEIEATIKTLEAIGSLANERASIKSLVEERQTTLQERQDRLSSLDDRSSELVDQREETTERIETIEKEIDEHRASVASCTEQLQELRERMHSVRELKQTVREVENTEETIERLRERREDLEQMQAERMDQLDDIDTRLAELDDELDEDRLTQLEAAHTNLAEELASVDESLDSLGEARDQLNEDLGSVQTDIEQLERLEQRREELEEQRAALDSLGDETEIMGELYESIRANLRERNVATLERLLNETFEILYRNDAYDRLHLEADYSLAISQKDGTELEPMQLSGGERAIFNLSIRCAIYRLLAEGVEGSAPMPPLMLDEPTVFLDEGHVSRLLRLLEAMREMGVEQTLVVSHHEALLDAAEQLIAVEKDPTTNRSTVRTLATGPQLT